MKKLRFDPALKKTFIICQDDCCVYSVNGFAVRNLAQPDEEFTNFATQNEFPNLIPQGEIWISDRVIEKEGVFFIANALTRMKRMAEGMPEQKAIEAGTEVDRSLREQITGVKFRDGTPHRQVPREIYVEPYLELADPEAPIQVWKIDGSMARCLYKTDYTEGGHFVVYPWVPKNEIWIEHDLDRKEVPYILSHEYLELRLMRDRGISYDKAHPIAAAVEFKLRKSNGLHALLAPGHRGLLKSDLPRLTSQEVFEELLKRHVKK